MPGPSGADAGVALHDGDVADVDADSVGHDLGDRGLQALAVAAAAHQRLDLSVDPDADDGGLARQAAHGNAGWLDVQPEADPEHPALLPRLRLLGPQLLVADHRHRLFERAGDRHLVVEHPARGRVWQVAVVDDVAPAQLERVETEPLRHDVDHLFAHDRLHQPRAAV